MGKKHDGISKIKVSMLKQTSMSLNTELFVVKNQTSMSLKTELFVVKNQVAEVRKEN